MSALAQARDEARRAERERVRAIFASQAAQTHPEAALIFAFQTDLTAAEIVAALAKIPAAASARRGMPHAPPQLSLGADSAPIGGLAI